MVAKKLIDYTKFNSKRISIVCRNVESVNHLVHYLTNEGMQVEVETSPFVLHKKFKSTPPGFVLISNEHANPANAIEGQNFVDYLQKKYKVPVLSFKEMTLSRIRTPLTPREAAPENEDEKRQRKLDEEHSSNEVQRLAKEIQAYREEFARTLENPKSEESLLHDPYDGLPERLTSLLSSQIDKKTLQFEEQDQLKVITLRVHQKNESGCFLFALPLRDEKSFQITLSHLKTLIQMESGQELEFEASQHIIHPRIYQQMEKNSLVSLEGTLQNQDFLMSYFARPSEVITDETLVEKAEMFVVPLEKWWTQIPLPFNSYLWLEKNNKKLLYIREGELMRLEAYERFQAAKSNRMWLTPDELQKYSHLRELLILSGLSSQ